MRKAIQLKVTLWIEGEDAPAHDFAASTTQTVRRILTDPRRRPSGLNITIKKIEEDDDEDDSADVVVPPPANTAAPVLSSPPSSAMYSGGSADTSAG